MNSEASDERGRSYWERHAKNYDRSMKLLGGPIPRMVELTAEAAQGSRRILEVAAGTGLVTTALARVADEVVATDYASEMIAKVAARIQGQGVSNVRCEQADIYALHYEGGSFDAVVAANVLHLLPDLQGALAALRGVLKRGGKLIVPTYCHDESVLSWVMSRALAITGFPGQRRFTVGSLHEALQSAGVRLTRTETLRGVIPIGYAEGTFAS